MASARKGRSALVTLRRGDEVIGVHDPRLAERAIFRTGGGDSILSDAAAAAKKSMEMLNSAFSLRHPAAGSFGTALRVQAVRERLAHATVLGNPLLDVLGYIRAAADAHRHLTSSVMREALQALTAALADDTGIPSSAADDDGCDSRGSRQCAEDADPPGVKPQHPAAQADTTTDRAVMFLGTPGTLVSLALSLGAAPLPQVQATAAPQQSGCTAPKPVASSRAAASGGADLGDGKDATEVLEASLRAAAEVAQEMRCAEDFALFDAADLTFAKAHVDSGAEGGPDLDVAHGPPDDEVRLVGERLNFAKVSGDGPESGWVSLTLKGRELLAPLGAEGEAVDLAWPESRAWRDLDGQSLGPWKAHEDQVTTVLFDHFSAPPDGCRRLFTACWSLAKVCCWELSAASGLKPPPRLLGELSVHGLVSDLAGLSGRCLLTAVSANPPPETGSACHQPDFKKRMAEQDDLLGAGDQLVTWTVPEATASAARSFPSKVAQKVALHARGCLRICTWPGSCGEVPQLAASASRDVLGVSRVGSEGAGLEEEAVWKAPAPHGEGGIAKHLAWASAESLWSGDAQGLLKVWDVGSGRTAAAQELRLGVEGLSGMVLQPSSGLLIAAHEAGLAFVDCRGGRLIRQQYTKDVVTAARLIEGERPDFLAGVGSNLVQYETRMLATAGGGSSEPKAQAVGVWTLPAKVLSVDCLRSASGAVLVAAGCGDGRVAVLDAS